MLDDLLATRWNAIGENHLKLDQKVAALGWVFHSGKPLPYETSYRSWPYDIAAWEGLHLSVKGRDVDRASAKSLKRNERGIFWSNILHIDQNDSCYITQCSILAGDEL